MPDTSDSTDPSSTPVTTTTDSTPTRAARFLLICGLVQGIGLWALWYAVENKLLDDQPGLIGLLFFLLIAAPFAIYWMASSNLPATRQAAIVLIVSAIAVVLGYHQGNPFGLPDDFRVRDFPRDVASLTFPAVSVLLFVLVHLLAGIRRNYETYFNLTWHNAIASALAAKFTGLVWLTLVAGSWLLRVIGIDWLWELIREPWFAIPVSSMAVSVGFIVARERMEMTVSLRRYWLLLGGGLLPVVIVLGVVWLFALPFQFDTDVDGQRRFAHYLFWFAALAIYCLNSAWQDGESTVFTSQRWQRLLHLGWFAMPVITIVAIWALSVRVGQYGWTESRIWGAVALAWAALHSIGYLLPIGSGRWMRAVAPVNVSVAWLICITGLVLCSPIADARKIAVSSQVNLLTSGTADPEEFDYRYLRHRSGPHGRVALDELANNGPTAQIRELSNKAKTYSRFSRPQTEVTAAQLRERIQVWPDGATLPEQFAESVVKHAVKRCHRAHNRCAAWQQDLDNDGQAEILLATGYARNNAPVVNRITVFVRNNTGYQQAGWINLGPLTRKPRRMTMPRLKDAVGVNGLPVAKARWPKLLLEDFPLVVQESAPGRQRK